MVIFRTFNVVQKHSSISSINIVMTLAKRKSIVFSIRPYRFGLSTNIFIWKNKGQQSLFLLKNPSIFHVFSKYFDPLDFKMEVPHKFYDTRR
jgi:hypothetical protein